MEAVQIYSEVSKRSSSASQGNAASVSHRGAQAFGYSEEELAAIPKGANLGWIQGDTVIDLGSGTGFDVFNVARKVKGAGKAIAVDMNSLQDMLAKARKLAEPSGISNTEFVESRIIHIVLGSGIADCVISNCVINLVPSLEKQQVFNEIFRLLNQAVESPYILIADSGADLNEYLDASSEESAEADGCRRCSGSMSAYASCNDILQHQLTNLNEWIIQVFQDFHHESDGQ
ncbi:hypothetical protein M433DRAFT_166320 [Acidomyces richmondensis BFW]|nr:MAG: hypothetical protein FE78DRAFT_108057 [Acidomyces sp. 'richmondensis']KYG45221.1 hypothetical protein M433DRAFT_166320 [Acidomyces richmondensis BFW]